MSQLKATRSWLRKRAVPSHEIGSPSMAISTSRDLRTSAAAQVCAIRVRTTPFCPLLSPRASRMCGFSVVWNSAPSVGKPVYRPWRSTSWRKCVTTGVGMTYPIFSASAESMLWNAIPMHAPSSSKAGPPLFPLLIAASICTPSSSIGLRVGRHLDAAHDADRHRYRLAADRVADTEHRVLPRTLR